jgi:hypothetical protein
MFLKGIRVTVFCFLVGVVNGQTLDGNSIYNFLGITMHSQTAAMGGRNVSLIGAGAGSVLENPALLRASDHQTFFSNFTFLAPAVTGLHASGAWHFDKIGTTFGLSLTHFGYGEEPLTDPAGNVSGTFRAFDQTVALSASGKYDKRWFYGASLKFIHAAYGPWRSSGVALDFGLNYFKEESGFQWGIAAKNMGVQLKTFNGEQEDLPFDLVMGITQKMAKAPFSISITAQRLHDFDILYTDTLFNDENFGVSGRVGWGKQALSHLIIGSNVYLGEKVILSGGFNFLRRNELAIRNISSGLTGFSYGIAMKHKKLCFQYSRSHNQRFITQQQISFAIGLSNSSQK